MSRRPDKRVVRGRSAPIAFVLAPCFAMVVGMACSDEPSAPTEAGDGGLEAGEVSVDATPASPPDASDASQVDGATADGAVACPSGLAGPSLVRVLDAGFCIDATEVTNAQYDLFLGATSGGRVDVGIPKGGLPAACAGHPGFGRKPLGDADGGAPSLPVSRVTWCDAYAYCAWSGKRLCGKRSSAADGGSGEWFTACSNAGTRDFPYPGQDPAGGIAAYSNTACNTNRPTGDRRPVASTAGCEGGIPGVFDMSGNVEEYLDGCDASQCPAAGGAYFNADRDVKCDSLRFVDRETLTLEPGSQAVGDGAGFRCCADER